MSLQRHPLGPNSSVNRPRTYASKREPFTWAIAITATEVVVG